MTGRERVEAAFSPAGASEIPAVICYEGLYIRDHQDEFAPCPWWHRFAPDLERQAAFYGRVIERTGQDWFRLAPGVPRAEREAVSLEERDGLVLRSDRRTGQTLLLEKPEIGGWTRDRGVHSVHPSRAPQTPEDLAAAIPLDPAWSPERTLSLGVWDLAALLLRRFGRTHYPVGYAASPLWCCYALWGFEQMMVLTAERPDLIRHACRRYLEREIRAVREQAAAGVAGIWIEECMTDMISPEAFAALNLPVLRELTDAIRDAGMHSLYYYCGNPAGRWNLLSAAGADALALEEGKKGWQIDIEDVVERAGGRQVVLGNLDAIAVLQKGSEGDLQREIARQLAAGRRTHGRFIMSLGSPVTPETPVARVRRYCDLVRQAPRFAC